VTGEATWHRLEHAGYSADLPIWREIAAEWGPELTEVGAGCGRVSFDLARHGFPVQALERSPALTSALRAAVPPELPLEVFEADVADRSAPSFPVHGLIIFPLLVTELICAQVGLEPGLEAIARFIPDSAKAAFSISGRRRKGRAYFQLPVEAAEVPVSQVLSVSITSSEVELKHMRVDRHGSDISGEKLVQLSATDLAGALSREPIQEWKISATARSAEGLVVLF